MLLYALVLLAALPLLLGVLGPLWTGRPVVPLWRRATRSRPVGGEAGQLSFLPGFDPGRDVIVIAHGARRPAIRSERLRGEGMVVTLDSGAQIALPGWQGALAPEHFAYVPAVREGPGAGSPPPAITPAA